MPHSVMEMHTVESSLEVNYPVEPPVTVEPIETYETTKQQVDQPYFITEVGAKCVVCLTKYRYAQMLTKQHQRKRVNELHRSSKQCR